MSKNLNCVVLQGNLVRDIEMNPAGTVGKFSIAVNESQKDQSGNWTDYASFIECRVFGKTASNLAKYLLKGKQVLVRGKLHQDRWEKDGQKQSRMVVIVDDLYFAGGNGGQSGGPAAPAPASGGNGDFPEDIPF